MFKTTVYMKPNHRAILQDMVENEVYSSLQDAMTHALEDLFKKHNISQSRIWPQYKLIKTQKQKDPESEEYYW